jgi:hypothetical protein
MRPGTIVGLSRMCGDRNAMDCLTGVEGRCYIRPRFVTLLLIS